MTTPNEDKPEEGIQVFAIAYDTKTKAATFAGTMPTVQAAGLIQQILQSEEREQIKKEVEAEIKEQGKEKT